MSISDLTGTAWLFIATTALTIFLFLKACNQKKQSILLELLVWAGIFAFFSLRGFFTDFEAMPPRFVFLLGPGMIVIAALFLTAGGRAFLDSLDLKWLTLLHFVRIPVEIVLLQVYLNGMIPELMTFEGYNFDILSGITAPLVYFLVFVSRKAGRKFLLFWNYACLALLLNILTLAVLSAPFPFQQLAHDQPNIAVAFFPYVWLPTIVVPLVLLSHLAAIRKLMKDPFEPGSIA